MNARETRFVGNGNVWVADGRYRGWQVVCRCGTLKVITGHNGSTLPPHQIIKKLEQAGWYVGRKGDEDLCLECRRRPRKAVALPCKIPASNGNGSAVVAENSPVDYTRQLRLCLTSAQKCSKLADAKELIGGALRGIRQLEAMLAVNPANTETTMEMKAARLAAYLGIDWHRDKPDKIAQAFIDKFGLERAELIGEAVEQQLSDIKASSGDTEDFQAWLERVDREHRERASRGEHRE
jgi:hypothetical protein